MFICEDCLKKYFAISGALAPLSYGPCEMCKRVRTCYDIPSSSLPTRIKPKPKPKTWSVS